MYVYFQCGKETIPLNYLGLPRDKTTGDQKQSRRVFENNCKSIILFAKTTSLNNFFVKQAL